MTASGFAASLNLSRGYLSELENGKRPISAKVLDALSRAGVRPEYIATGQGDAVDVRNRTDDSPVFFEARGKQVSESAAGGAFAQGGPGSGYALDPERHSLLQQVITAVLARLEEQGLSLEPAKAAELILLIYDDIADTEMESIGEDHVTKKASRLLRLVG